MSRDRATASTAWMIEDRVRLALKKNLTGPGMMAQAYNPSTLGGRGWWIMRSRDRDHSGQHGETPSLLKIQKFARHGNPSYSGG